MAAGVCLRSAAAEEQEKQTCDKLSLGQQVNRNSEAMALQEAMAGRIMDVRCAATAAWTFNSGDSLRLVGSWSDVPEALRKLWDVYNQAVLQILGERGRSQTIQPPPLNLATSSQAVKKKLLLQVMSDHGMSDAELSEAFRGFVLTADNMIKLVDVAERLRAGLPCILMSEAGCGKTVPMPACTCFPAVFLGSGVKGGRHSNSCFCDCLRCSCGSRLNCLVPAALTSILSMQGLRSRRFLQS